MVHSGHPLICHSGHPLICLHGVHNYKLGDLELILTVCLELGLRLPKEHTYKFITSVWTCVSERREVLINMPFGTKKALLAAVKKEWAGLVSSWRRPLVFLETLPQHPFHLLKDYPMLYQSAFPVGQG